MTKKLSEKNRKDFVKVIDDLRETMEDLYLHYVLTEDVKGFHTFVKNIKTFVRDNFGRK